jgi:Fur family ferric uptake transcriptional regulator
MDLAKRLRSRGHRLTPQRKAVFEVLAGNEGRPLNPEDVYVLARDKHPGLGLTTVYRTLELFQELEIVLPVHLHGDSHYFEINTGKHHHHMVCISCNRVEVVDACLIEDIEEIVRDGSDFMITSHCMSLFGYCRSCMGSGKRGNVHV